MSSIEIIEEYRALWAQAQQELQMTQILVAVVLKESGLDNLQVPTRTLQEVAEASRQQAAATLEKTEVRVYR